MVRLLAMSGRRWLLFGSGLAGMVILTGCALPAASQGALGEATPARVASPPRVEVQPADRSTGVPLDATVRVSASAGTLTSVAVTEVGAGSVAGALASDGHTWVAAAALDPNATYRVSATALGAGGTHTSSLTTFSTIPVAQRLLTSVTPADGQTVGVGEPITLRFNAPISAASQPDLVRRLSVTSTPAQTGAWHWYSPTEIHYRPQNFWSSGTTVSLNAHLRGLDAGGGVWGLGDFSESFTVGAKHVSTLDNNTHQMQVFENDKLLYTWPVSMGKPGFATLEGTLTVLYKQYAVRMNSCATFGGAACIPGGANYYNEDVYWDTAISSNGYFIHSAPWSVAQQGVVNVSHGCVNLAPDNAVTFFKWSQVGDVVLVSNTGNIADESNGEADWQIPFAQYDNTGVAARTSPVPAGTPGGA